MNVKELDSAVKYAGILKVPTSVHVHLVMRYHQMAEVVFLTQVYISIAFIKMILNSFKSLRDIS